VACFLEQTPLVLLKRRKKAYLIISDNTYCFTRQQLQLTLLDSAINSEIGTTESNCEQGVIVTDK